MVCALCVQRMDVRIEILWVIMCEREDQRHGRRHARRCSQSGRRTMQARRKIWSTTAALLALLSTAAPTTAGADNLVDGPAGKLPLYDGEGTVGFDIYNGAVSRWA